MLKKDVEEGVEYAASMHARLGDMIDGRAVREGRFEHVKAHEMEGLGISLIRVRVVELDAVPAIGRGSTRWAAKTRPGVMVERLDRETGEKQSWGSSNGVEHWTRWMAYGQLQMSWERWTMAWADWLTGKEEESERRRVEAEQEKARRQEAAAKRWMEEEFRDARSDIVQVKQALGWYGGPADDPSDDEVRALVDLRNPDGNPYLNGEREAH